MKRLWDSVAGNSAGDQKMQVLTDKVNFLNARASDVRKELEDAEIQPGKKRREEVNQWLIFVEAKTTECRKIQKEGQEQGFNSWLTGRIEKMTREVQELHQQGVFPDGLVLSDHERLPLLVTKPVGEMFQMNIEKIMGWLRNPLQFMFGIYGMGGVGKTTLLMQIHDLLLKDSSILRRVYWVTVSQNCSLHKLQQDIAKVVGVDLSEEDDEKKRAALLHDRLGKIGNKVFILDDMWEASYVEDIGIPLGESGCKVILTTRSLEVCRRMGCGEFILEVKTLARNEARNLFIDQLINYGELSAEVKQTVDLVADECSCLPLAIVTTGRCMRAVTCIYEWKNALNELRNPSRKQGDMEKKVLLKLKFSYDCLGDKTLQHCFLSCVLYPVDGRIPRKELICLWMMEGLLDFAGSNEEQLYKGHSILNTLLNSCLLEPHTSDWLKMHDLIRDMGIFITRKDPLFISKPRLGLKEVPKEEQWTEDLVKVSLRQNRITEIGHDMSPPRCPRLSVLMLSRNPLKGIPESFFVHMTALRVLDLSYTPIERLPESVSDLETLRGILLRGCYKLKYVPSLAKLTNLRVLDLPLDAEIKEPPRGMERLKCLEKISYCRWNQSEWTYFSRSIESWELSTLCYYHVDLHGGLNAILLDTEDKLDENLYDKKVVIEDDEFVLKALHRIMELVSMMQCEMEGRRSLTEDLPSLGGATELKALKIIGWRGLEYVLVSQTTQQVSCNFSQLDSSLEVISLARLPDLRGVINLLGEGGDDGDGGEFTLLSSPSPFLQPITAKFSHLKRIFIEECPKIKVVFQFKWLLHHQQTPLRNLEEICVWHCEELEEIFEAPNSSSSNSNSSSNGTNPNPIVTLPNLRILKFLYLPKLKSIYRGLLLCPSLQDFDTHDCPEFKMLPFSEPLICDASASTLASIPTEKDNPHWWQPLHRDYPDDARVLSDLVHRSQQQQQIPTNVPAVSHRLW